MQKCVPFLYTFSIDEYIQRSLTTNLDFSYGIISLYHEAIFVLF